MKNNTINPVKRIFLFLCFMVLLAVLTPGIESHAEENGEVKVDNGIPVVYLYIDESRGSIEDMLASPDHSVYCYGTVSIHVPEGFRYADFPEQELKSFEGLEMSIRGRGNSTWQKVPKRPFKIKLDKKADLFGLGSNKHWVLVANYFDETLLRDRITGWIGDEMGFAFTPRGVPVDLVMVGENYGTQYLGSYYFSENVRVDKNRLEIEELDENDTDPEIITGGYLLQNALQVRAGSPDRFYTSRGIDWATHTPSFDTEENSVNRMLNEDRIEEEDFAESELGDGYKNSPQQEYIQNYIQHFEDVLFENGTEYRELMDLESTAKYWLVNMVSMNTDAYGTGSTYIYKDRDPKDGVAKLYWGPLWDFDYAWENNFSTTGFSYGHEWMKPMFYDTGEGGFVEELHKWWPVMKDAMERLIAEGGLLDKYYEETKLSAERNSEIYREGAEFDYHKEGEELRTWIRKRIDWVDENLSTLDTMMHKITFMVNGETYATVFRADGEHVEFDEKHPELDGYTFVGWLDPQGQLIEKMIPVTENMVITARYIPDSELTHARDIALPKTNDIIKYSPFFKVYSIKHKVLPEDAEDKVVNWSSSDPSLATVSSEGVVVFNGTGTVTITAGLRLGRSREFTLTITNEELPVVEAVHPDQDSITMTPGELRPLSIVTSPSPASTGTCSYESADSSVVTVDEYGVLTAVSLGETTINIRVEVMDQEGNESVLETSAAVKVTEKTTPPDVDPPVDPGREEKGFDWRWAAIPAVSAIALAVILSEKKEKKSE